MTYDPSNIFAKILRQEATCDKVYETDHTLVFKDIFPKAPIHLLVIPKGQYINYHDFMNKATQEEILDLFKTINTVVKDNNLEDAYKLSVHTGEKGGQLVPHFHVHIMGGF